MKFEVFILGSNSAIPTLKRHPSAQLVTFDQMPYLIDCGEGTQLQLRRYRKKFQRIGQIFISHLHGDHYYGLPGLLTSMHLLGREKPLTIFGPKGIEEILAVNFKHSGTMLRYQLEIIALEPGNTEYIYQDEKIKVRSIDLDHRVDTFGYVFEEQKHELKVDKSAIEKYELSLKEILDVKANRPVFRSGEKIDPEELSLKPAALRSYAYCSDTGFKPELSEVIKNIDLLYHEATFMEDMRKRAKETLHSTAKQAAEIAKISEVKRLIIGHFSTRYDDLDGLLEEARSIFRNTDLALEGEAFEIVSH